MSLEKMLSEVLDMMQKIVTTTIAKHNLNLKAKELVRLFDEGFTTLSKVASTQTQAKHDGKLFDTVCMNVRNDLKALDVCVKELRKHINEGKKLYG